MRIVPELIAGNKEYEQDLGSGLAFGSRRVVSAERLALEFVRDDAEGKLSRFLLFDWWDHPMKNQVTLRMRRVRSTDDWLL